MLGLGYFYEVDLHIGRKQGVVWRSARSAGLDLHDKKHWILQALIAGCLKHAVHILLNACWRPNGLECVKIGVNRVDRIAAISNPETRIGDMELAPARLVAFHHVDLRVTTLSQVRTTSKTGIAGEFVGGLAIRTQQPEGRPQRGILRRHLTANGYRTVGEIQAGPLNVAGDVRP